MLSAHAYKRTPPGNNMAAVNSLPCSTLALGHYRAHKLAHALQYTTSALN